MSQKHARPPMTRRASPAPSAEQDTREYQGMMETLAKHAKMKINGTGSSAPTGDASVSGGVGDGQINAGVAPARTLPRSTIHAEAEHRETSVREALSQPLGTSAPFHGSSGELIAEAQLPDGPGVVNAQAKPSPLAAASLAEQQEALGALTGAPPLREDPRDPAPPVEAITQHPVVPAGYKDTGAVLEWEKPVRWADGSGYIRSTGGTYTVVKERSGDTWRYVAFHGINALGVSQTAVDGQGKCALHYLEACDAFTGGLEATEC